MEAANNRRNRAGGAREAVSNRSNIIEWAREAVNNRRNNAGGAREVELTTGAIVLEGPERLLKQEQQCWRYQGGCLQHDTQCWRGEGGCQQKEEQCLRSQGL